MSSTLLRFGLWIVLISLSLYVLRETFLDDPNVEFLSAELLQKIGGYGVLLFAAGGVLHLVENAVGKATNKSRCAVCKQPVRRGDIYCREHLRQVVEREDTVIRRTRVR